MSRRVFDVGLDMGRIRNGLKPNRDGKNSRNFRSSQAVEAKGGYLDSQAYADARMAVVKHSRGGADASEDAAHPDLDAFDPDLPLPPSQFNSPTGPKESLDEAGAQVEQDLTRRPSGDALNFDLKPPPPNTKVRHLDSLAERLFSGDHLQVILQDPTFFLRFTAFLNRYKPRAAPLLVKYLDAIKACKAVEYANALAESFPVPHENGSTPQKAASIEPWFETSLNRSFESLVNETLPAYVTNALTRVVTEIMVREITGSGMPLMRELVGGLAEVFCLADPSLQDCPIVYASEEFYHTTRYARDDVLGHNCRFLQGPKTSRAAVDRIRTAVKAGQESCETLLNYRRDGTAFMNLLLTAPLYDNRGAVRYFLGAQVDVSGLIEDGRGLDSFERLLKRPTFTKSGDHADDDENPPPKHLKVLSEFGQMLSLDESSLLQQQSSRPSSRNGDDAASDIQSNGRPGTAKSSPGSRRGRRVLGVDDDDAPVFDSAKAAGPINNNLASGGRLPGVYQNYLLVRPHPSLRVIFVSPALRIPGLLQSPFLSRIGGPPHVRSGLAEAFEQGAAVTAKVTWLPRGQPGSDSTSSNTNGNNPERPPGKSHTAAASAGGPPANSEPSTRYISCTPLLGSDDQVGVWMVIMVENELVTGGLASRQRAFARFNAAFPAGGGAATGDSAADDTEYRPSVDYARDDDKSHNPAPVQPPPESSTKHAAAAPASPTVPGAEKEREKMHQRTLSGGSRVGGGAKRFEFASTPPRSSSRAANATSNSHSNTPTTAPAKPLPSTASADPYAEYIRKSSENKAAAAAGRASGEHSRPSFQQSHRGERGTGGFGGVGGLEEGEESVIDGRGRIEEILTPAEEKGPPRH